MHLTVLNFLKPRIRIVYPTCMVNRVKTYKKSDQAIEHNKKLSLIKIDMTGTVDMVDFRELQLKSHDRVTIKL